MLRSYGEIVLSEDEQLIQEMMNAALSVADNGDDVEEGAASEDGGGDVVLDGKSFAAALTNDVQSYEIDKEASMTTRFADVFSSKTTTSDQGGDDEGKKQKEQKKVMDQKDLNRVYTAPSIDFTAGTYRSQQLTIALRSKYLISKQQQHHMQDPQ